jgi:hypothetical protein
VQLPAQQDLDRRLGHRLIIPAATSTPTRQSLSRPFARAGASRPVDPRMPSTFDGGTAIALCTIADSERAQVVLTSDRLSAATMPSRRNRA